jgi:hypothetical protein
MVLEVGPKTEIQVGAGGNVNIAGDVIHPAQLLAKLKCSLKIVPIIISKFGQGERQMLKVMLSIYLARLL